MLLRSLTLPALFIAVVGCTHPEPPHPQKPQMVEVSTFSIAPVPYSPSITVYGLVKPSAQVNLQAKSGGRIVEKTFEDGQHIKEGQLLYRLDPAEAQINVSQALASLTAAQANKKNAEREFQRMSELIHQSAVSKQQYDQALHALELANSQIESAQAAVAYAENDLAERSVYAPFSGKIALGTKDAGDYVSLGTALATLSRVDTLWIEFPLTFAQKDFLYGGHPIGHKASIKLANGQIVEAQQIIHDAAADPSSGSILLRAVIDNKDLSIIAGQHAHVEIKGHLMEQTILIPQKAVLRDDEGSYVYLLEEGTVNRRPVTTGAFVGADWLIKEGLGAEDTVITDNLLKIGQGMPVSKRAD